jgi:hypothetical protein
MVLMPSLSRLAGSSMHTILIHCSSCLWTVVGPSRLRNQRSPLATRNNVNFFHKCGRKNGLVSCGGSGDRTDRIAGLTSLLRTPVLRRRKIFGPCPECSPWRHCCVLDRSRPRTTMRRVVSFLAENNLVATTKGMFLAFLAQSQNVGPVLHYLIRRSLSLVDLEPDDVLGWSFISCGADSLTF